MMFGGFGVVHGRKMRPTYCSRATIRRSIQIPIH
jgi:hypothetical protein